MQKLYTHTREPSDVRLSWLFIGAQSASIANSSFSAFYTLQADWQQRQRRKGDNALTLLRFFNSMARRGSFNPRQLPDHHCRPHRFLFLSIDCANALHTICFYRHHNLPHRNLSKHFMMQIARMFDVDDFHFAAHQIASSFRNTCVEWAKLHKLSAIRLLINP